MQTVFKTLSVIVITMNKKDNKYGYYSSFLFLIWPFLAVISAFSNYRNDWGKNLLWAFIAFYGFTFAIGIENSNSDINRYVEEYKQLHHEDLTFEKGLEYYQKSGEIDVARTLIAVTLSRFTDQQSILTLVYGIILGFFFSRNMWFVLERVEGEIKPITILLFAVLFLVIPIWGMNGFRMWTAAHIFIYGLLPFLFEGNRKGLFISFLSVLVHFSFIVPLAVLAGYLFLGNRLVLYFSFFLLTLFISEINLEAFNQVVENYAPEIIQERTASYRSELKVEEYREGPERKLNWYVVWYGRALNWSIAGFLIVLFLKARNFFNENIGWLNLFSFTLLFLGVANLFTSLPSGGRFVTVAQLCALVLITLYVQNRRADTVMKRYIIAAIPALLLYVIVAFRTGLYSTSATAVLGNPFIAVFMTEDFISLNDVMKMIL